jgi:acyl carrier protein
MDLQEFIKYFAEQFEEGNPSQFNKETKYKEVEGWSSLKALFIIGMADEKYQVKIKGEDIRQSQTIGDLYEIIKSRI